MLYLTSALAAISGALHIFIFYLEVFAWASPLARNIFGSQSSEELAITTFYAYNQGVYNLALAILALSGALVLPYHSAIGLTLILSGCGSMLLAALALGCASSKHRAAACKQGIIPLLTLISCLALYLH